jgi:hypothetical protein
LEEPIDRPTPQLPPLHPNGSDYAKPDKEQEEEDLSYASDRYDAHCSIDAIDEIVQAVKDLETVF